MGDYEDGSNGGSMNNAELTRQVKALWKAQDRLADSIAVMTKELSANTRILERIEVGLSDASKRVEEQNKRFDDFLTGLTQPKRCVEYAMQIKTLEEQVEELEKSKCKSCPNTSKIEILQKSQDKMSDTVRWFFITFGGGICLWFVKELWVLVTKGAS